MYIVNKVTLKEKEFVARYSQAKGGYWKVLVLRLCERKCYKLVEGLVENFNESIRRFKSKSLYIRYNQIIRWFKNFVERENIQLVRHCAQEHIEKYLLPYWKN